MSYTKSSALKWFEALLEDTRRKVSIASKKFSLNKLIENSVKLGDVVFPKLVYLSEKIAEIIGRLQVTMIESMITASMWCGLLLLALVTLVILATR